jgi:DNA (cytosine-5)-methyltransferase 1
MKLIDLFCGSGGFSLGAHQAGFAVSAAYDIDPVLTSSFKTNFPLTKLVLADISRLDERAIRESVGAKHIDGIFGGPPCQGFSNIGRRDPEDPRRQLLGHFFRIVKEVGPTFFVMENVRGLGNTDAREVLDHAICLVKTDYDILGPITLDASDFGAATKRQRLFVIGVRKDEERPLTLADIKAFQRPAQTVEAAIADLSDAVQLEIKDGFDWWRISRPGRPTTYAAALRSSNGTFTGQQPTVHSSAVVKRFEKIEPGKMDEIGRHPRLQWSGQCPTLRAGTGSDRGSYQSVRPIHPDQPRVITVREAARLQGFPDAHLFHPTVWHSFRMIGNSVAPIMAKAIFCAIKKRLERVEGQVPHAAAAE